MTYLIIITSIMYYNCVL